MSGEGGASRGDGDGEGSEVDMMEVLPPPSHLSQLRLLFRGSSRLFFRGSSMGLFLLAKGSEVGLGCGMGSVLASLVAALTFISAKVIVPCVLVVALGVDTFLEGTGELTDDLREAAGLPREVFLLRLLLRSMTTLSGDGSKTMSATLGDSVSLKAKFCLHFSCLFTFIC